MTKRILSALLVLVLLISVIPFRANAAEYRVGDTIWTNGEEPTAETELYARWIPVIREDGVQEYRQAEGSQAYEYQWIVEEYYGPREREGIPTSFQVRNVDEEGTPLAGTEFLLFEIRGEDLFWIASAKTDEDGIATFDDLCLEKGCDSAVWHLVQTNFPDSPLSEYYYPYTGRWDVYITRNADGTHSLTMEESSMRPMMLSVGDDDASSQTKTVDNWNQQTSVLTVSNERIPVELSVYVNVDGDLDLGEEVYCPVQVIHPNGNKQTLRPAVPTDKPSRIIGRLRAGNYTFAVDEEAMSRVGYDLTVTYSIARVGEEAVESTEGVVALDSDHTAATAVITLHYTEKGDRNTVIAQVKDEDGNPLKNAVMELLDEQGEQVQTITTDGSGIKLNDWIPAPNAGETVTYTLRQLEAADGYEASEAVYHITVKESNGKVTFKAEKDANFFVRLFTDGVDTGTNGEQVINFANKMIPAKLTVQMDCGSEPPVDEVKITLQNDNVKQELVFSEGKWNQNLNNIPRATYIMTMEADVTGYTLTTAFQTEGCAVNDGTLMLQAEKATLTVQNRYEKEKDLVTVLFVDEAGDPVVGAENNPQDRSEVTVEVPVIGDITEADKDNTGEIKVDIQALMDENKDKIEQALDMLGSISLKMKQTKVPAGYVCSEEVYTILVKRENNQITYDILGEDGLSVGKEVRFTNQRQLPNKTMLTVKMEFGENGIPDDLTQIPVTFAGTYGSETVTFSAAEGWTKAVELYQTEYTISQNIELPDGYEQSSSFQLNGEDVAGSTISLTKANEALTITNTFTYAEDAIAVIRTVDADQKPLGGAEYGLYHGEDLVHSKQDKDGDGNISFSAEEILGLVENYQAEIMNGEEVVFVGKQTKAPSGYAISPMEYSIALKMDNDGPQCEIRDSEGNEVQINEEDGKYYMTFTNEKSDDNKPEDNKPEDNKPDDNKPEDNKKPDAIVNTDFTAVIIIRTLAEDGQSLGGAKYGLYYGNTAIRSFTDTGSGSLRVENMATLLGSYEGLPTLLEEGLTLKQITPPKNMVLSNKSYPVKLKWEHNFLKLEVIGAEIDKDQNQVVDFVNKKTPTEDEGVKIAIRTVDMEGDTMTGAEYCLSEDLYFDKDEDVIYKTTDENGDVIIEDVDCYVANGETKTLYLMQSRQPQRGSLSTQRFKVVVRKVNGETTVSIKEDQSLLEGLQKKKAVQEKSDNNWLVTFSCNPKETVINLSYEERITWNDLEKSDEVIQTFKRDAYEFLLHWEYEGKEQNPKTLTLSDGESGSFDPIPYGSLYRLEAVKDGCYKTEITKGVSSDIADTAEVNLEAKVTYNIIKDKPLSLDMMRVDADSESSVPGAMYTLKNGESEVLTTYETGKYGEFVVEEIQKPGIYTLTETSVPDGFGKIKNPIPIQTAIAYEEGEDENGDPAILQVLDTQITDKAVKQDANGIYRISEAKAGLPLPLILGGVGVVAAGAAGASVVLLRRRKKKAAIPEVTNTPV